MFSMMSKYGSPLRLTLLIVWLGGVVPVAQAVPPQPSTSAVPPTTIDSERMTVRNKEQQAVFEGKVVLTRADLVVHSDKMIVFYKPKTQEASGGTAPEPNESEKSQTGNLKVSKIEATGRVRIEKHAGRATCEKAVYYKDEEKLVLTGKPVAWEKGNRVTGKQITMFLLEDRTIVEGGSRLLLD